MNEYQKELRNIMTYLTIVMKVDMKLKVYYTKKNKYLQ